MNNSVKLSDVTVKIAGARVLVKEIKLTDETKSGILIQGRSKEQTNKGIVLAVGTGSMLENGQLVPVNINVGDKVLYSSFSGSPIKVNAEDKEEYLILNERDILCSVEED